MADKGSGDRTIAEIDNEAIEKFNRQLQQSMEREAKLLRHYEWRGNKLPPFNIEHMPHERQRLSGSGMTAEDRALRRQWLKDQELSPNEPRYVSELYPKNPIRRAFSAPWEALFKALRPVLGDHYTGVGRFFVPKIAAATVLMYCTYYHMKYNSNTWQDKHGWYIYSSKPTLLPHDAVAPSKEYSDYYDRGFKTRQVLLDVNNTSTSEEIIPREENQ